MTVGPLESLKYRKPNTPAMSWQATRLIESFSGMINDLRTMSLRRTLSLGNRLNSLILPKGAPRGKCPGIRLTW